MDRTMRSFSPRPTARPTPTARHLVRALTAAALSLLAPAAAIAAPPPGTAAPLAVHVVRADVARPATPPPVDAGWSGVFRMEASRDHQVVPMLVLVERAGDGVRGTVLVDNQASALERVRQTSDELRATMRTSLGVGELVLRPTGAGVAGTLQVGTRTWRLVGQRSL